MSHQLDWTNYEEPKEYEPDKPGVYTVRVATCEERVSAKGDAFFSVGLESTELGRIVAYDIIMLEGRGANIGLCKLERLGFTPFDWSILRFEIDLAGELPRPTMPPATFWKSSRIRFDAGTIRAVNSLIFIMNVRPSVTTRWFFPSTW